MTGGIVILAVNVAVAAVYVFAHAIIAISNREQRAALWFSAAYFIGMLSPLADFLVPFVGMPNVLEWVSYFGLLGAMLLVSAGLGIYHRLGAPWHSIAAILAIGMVILAAAQLQRGPVSYGFVYQLPFVLASLLAACCAYHVPNRRLLHVALAGLYLVLAVNFLIKPLLADAVGAGTSLAEYSSSTYALLSQAGTGILLLVSGIVLLLLVAQNAIATSLAKSEVDPMSGLYNRRGFEWRTEQALARADGRRGIRDAAARRIDRDGVAHRRGNPGGDRSDRAPLGRGNDGQRGSAERSAGETLTQLMRRADAAAYQAKREGRNRICRPAQASAT